MSINDLLNYKWDVSTLFLIISIMFCLFGIIIIKNPSEKYPRFAGIILTICGSILFVIFASLNLLVDYHFF